MHVAPLASVRNLLAAVVVAMLAMALLPALPAAGNTVKYDNRLFGVHDSGLGSLGHGTVGSIRLWDAGTTWRDIERSPGQYDFSRLDQIVTSAQARNIEVTLVLGMTPDFYATAGGGATSMPSDLGAWTRYVTTVVNRYKSWNGRRGIAAYQVWNEANVRNFWTGSPMQMAQLTRATWHAVKGADKGAVVVGPAFAARIAEQTRGIGLFFQIKLSGRPIWRYMNVISLNLYPLDRYGSKLGTPETSMSLLAKTRQRMRLWGRVPASKPIWNTEVNYGMRTGTYGGTKAVSISSERQAAYVIRTYLLNPARGVKRVHWYTWNMSHLPAGGTLGNTLLTDPSDGATLTLAGRAFGLVKGWMAGGKLVGASSKAQPCASDRRGTYTCIIKYRGGVKRVYWNPNKKVKIKAPAGATFMVGVYGKKARVKGGKSIKVDYRPVMVRSKR
jgi:hypothetical protein